MLNDLIYSRPQATAAKLGEYALEKDHFLKRAVLLTGEAEILQTANGSETFLCSLRLLIRICRNVAISIPSGLDVLREECHKIIENLGMTERIPFLIDDDYEKFDAILNVGSRGSGRRAWTVINSNGWLARISSEDHLSYQCDQDNPVGALAAASLGVSEVFKKLVNLKPERGSAFNSINFNVYDYSANNDPGPRLEKELHIDCGIVGTGAIGNGIIHLLSRLPIKGRAWLVDAQKFEAENYGTCLLIGPNDIGKPKAVFAEEILKPRIDARGYEEDFLSFKLRLGKEIPHPRLIINGLDNIPVRHEIQNLWPDVIIDGAIGDFACQVSRHPWNEDSACLMCLFREPSGPAAENLASQATGLTKSRILEATETDVITVDDVKIAPQERRNWLHQRIGKPLCSVVSEGVIQKISQDQSQKGFEPSVPFVACLSACMIASELVKTISGRKTTLETRFQFDVLQGPTKGQFIPQTRRDDCICLSRRHNIEIIRESRFRKSP